MLYGETAVVHYNFNERTRKSGGIDQFIDTPACVNIGYMPLRLQHSQCV